MQTTEPEKKQLTDEFLSMHSGEFIRIISLRNVGAYDISIHSPVYPHGMNNATKATQQLCKNESYSAPMAFMQIANYD